MKWTKLKILNLYYKIRLMIDQPDKLQVDFKQAPNVRFLSLIKK